MQNFQSHFSLKKYNTFAMDVAAESFAVFNNLEECKGLLQNHTTNQPLLVLGGGSNILFTDDVEGLVIKNNIKGLSIISENDTDVLIEVGAGEVWHEFVLYTVNHNWSGIENLSLIPGSVGASPIQNIGAYGVEIKDVMHSLKALNIASLESKTFTNQECEFGYRDSIFKRHEKNKWIITSVCFNLKKEANINTSYGAIQDTLNNMGITNPSVKDVSNAVIAIRQSKLPDPALVGNCGSFFKNPEIPKKQYESLKLSFPTIPSYPINEQTVKVPAGWLIEQAGWKGKRFDNYGVHAQQALVLVNYGGAQGAQIKQLALDIQHSIWETFGIQLEVEVNIM